VAHEKVVVHVDGGSRGNPGPAAAGAVATAPDGTLLGERAEYIGEETNNVAEYRAIQLGIALAKELGAKEVELINDSQLVARQIGGDYKVKNKGLMPLYLDTMRALRESFERWSVRDVRREQNERADQLVNEELDRQASGGLSPEGTDPSSDTDEEELADLLRRWAHAVEHREMAFLEKLLAPEFTLTTGRPGAEVRTREQYLAITRDDYEVDSWEFEELVVQSYKRFAVVRSRYRQTGRMGADERDGVYLMTDALVKQAGRWRAVARHITPLTT
jgi:ribonuclease HI